ncbi:outer membrane lipid asymmetry maintenance protein MlaD [Phaeobacter italicus]|mgnify:CR=1 FL=1|jgi:phospholipid/cholesterol/gamma-HCH transport system substrate-binding protein|uniref:Putative phospholipid ABC transporter-binding protein MlaD n=1 Tax=Phaeobacter italicus TaxID=481446 RepID=A0A0H5DAS7_9RHOB|nr:outer membrane lipid asymmetry maintenance protein MlaD [Phaeobacter italicus]EEB70547.1 ABC transporter substrate binding protein [Ruegeria sp. R11]MEC8575033.1 outer membrane lipid asymmetry maintenance protein MlaD [Pseudomonadota bacterium]NKX70514.1 outer membrane lipid asymmetry maintenance protein MlaD [Rhodobacteraceae bacterium R_SAG1]MBY5975355.1 outer membrane lipid asymmetry maintenance protein MlaD [Phaeobacter italicus]MBY6042942.1 outer membrane lipid asymmetry maintenance pr
MSHNTTEVLAGGLVLAAAIGFAVYAGQAAGISSGGSSYELNASFRSLEGVSVGTDVRLAGVKIGTVTGVDLNPQTFRADTRFSVQDGIEIPDDSAIVISSEGLLGGNFVEVMPGGSPFAFEPGDAIEDTQGAVSLISLLVKFVAGSGDES